MDIRTLTSTLCRLMNIEPPASSIDEVQTYLLESLNGLGIGRIKGCLAYAPDHGENVPEDTELIRHWVFPADSTE
ncbi:MAG: hypothetical protein JW712_03600 [Dehalococcoidales bacterium]|nr:hypothetical protein [Dehalococcoidales bacterium]